MDKKKLIEYTEWVLNYAEPLGAKKTAKHFLKVNPGFFDEPDPKEEPSPWDELFQAKEAQSQTGAFEITFKLTKQ